MMQFVHVHCLGTVTGHEGRMALEKRLAVLVSEPNPEGESSGHVFLTDDAGSMGADAETVRFVERLVRSDDKSVTPSFSLADPVALTQDSAIAQAFVICSLPTRTADGRTRIEDFPARVLERLPDDAVRCMVFVHKGEIPGYVPGEKFTLTLDKVHRDESGLSTPSYRELDVLSPEEAHRAADTQLMLPQEGTPGVAPATPAPAHERRLAARITELETLVKAHESTLQDLKTNIVAMATNISTLFNHRPAASTALVPIATAPLAQALPQPALALSTAPSLVPVPVPVTAPPNNHPLGMYGLQPPQQSTLTGTAGPVPAAAEPIRSFGGRHNLRPAGSSPAVYRSGAGALSRGDASPAAILAAVAGPIRQNGAPPPRVFIRDGNGSREITPPEALAAQPDAKLPSETDLISQALEMPTASGAPPQLPQPQQPQQQFMPMPMTMGLASAPPVLAAPPIEAPKPVVPVYGRYANGAQGTAVRGDMYEEIPGGGTPR